MAERTPIEPEDAHILVVEDNPSNFALTARLLAYTGVKHPEWRTTGWGVVEYAEQMGRVDLILMDLRLPVVGQNIRVPVRHLGTCQRECSQR